WRGRGRRRRWREGRRGRGFGHGAKIYGAHGAAPNDFCLGNARLDWTRRPTSDGQIESRPAVGPAPALSRSAVCAYIGNRRREPAMAINGRRNKPIGPGGSTRRLHPRPMPMLALAAWAWVGAK